MHAGRSLTLASDPKCPAFSTDTAAPPQTVRSSGLQGQLGPATRCLRALGKVPVALQNSLAPEAPLRTPARAVKGGLSPVLPQLGALQACRGPSAQAFCSMWDLRTMKEQNCPTPLRACLGEVAVEWTCVPGGRSFNTAPDGGSILVP